MKLNTIDWTTTLFMIITPLVGVIGGGLHMAHHGFVWQTWALLGVMCGIAGMGITMGYHRLFSHRTYEAKWIVRLALMISGTAAFEGSVLEWCNDHRDHHRYTDTDKDPYNAKRGFWYSHIGWLFSNKHNQRRFNDVDDLKAEAMMRFQHKWFVPMASFLTFVLPMLIAGLWGDWLGGLLIAGAIRVTITLHGTFCINSVCHIIGKATYSDRVTARDNWFTALLTFGEGYHNFHHKFPLDYRNAIRYYQFDPSKWFIFALSKLGLTYNLKRVPFKRIMQSKLAMDELRIAQSNLNLAELPLFKYARETVDAALLKFDELEKSYQLFKQQGLLKAYKASLKATKKEIKASLKVWMQIVENAPRLALATVPS